MNDPTYIRGWDDCAAEILNELQSVDREDKDFYYKIIFRKFYGVSGNKMSDSDLKDETRCIELIMS